ncbi:MAG: hypothetical protein HYZ89_02415 [Candidatus Omnitrophica bacterium]|nr:hypothetical protein [Candidatus Omnitrophota bacterium]
MGTFRESIRVANLRQPKETLDVEALVDTGATYSWVPEELLKRLRIKPQETRALKIANKRPRPWPWSFIETNCARRTASHSPTGMPMVPWGGFVRSCRFPEPRNFAERNFCGKVIRRKLGWASVSVRGKTAPTPVLFGDKGSEVLLGAVTLEELGFSVDPIHRTLVPATAYLLSLF